MGAMALFGSSCGRPQKFNFKKSHSPKEKNVWQSKELKGCVPSSFSYACIDGLAIQFDLASADYHFI